MRRDLVASRAMFLIAFLALSSPVFAEAGAWVRVPGQTLADLLQKHQRAADVESSSGLSWPDGRQAIVTFVRVKQSGREVSRYRCIENFQANMQGTGGACRKLVKSQKSILD